MTTVRKAYRDENVSLVRVRHKAIMSFLVSFDIGLKFYEICLIQ